MGGDRTNKRDRARKRKQTAEHKRVIAESITGGRWPLDSVASVLVGASPAILLGTMGYARRWVSEDAFIDFRVVHNLLHGQGPVFNVGERVEAYTNPLWVALLALWEVLGGRLEFGAVVLGLVLSIAGIIAAQAGAGALASRLDQGGDDPTRETRHGIAIPLGMLVFAAIPAVWDFATSGLETGLVFGWLGLVFWLVARSASGGLRAWSVSAAALGLGPLIRPDLAIFSAAFLLALCLTGFGDAGARWRNWARLALTALALPMAYQVFRMGYFAALVPNTALAKEAGAAYWAQGWLYARDFFGTYVLWVPMLLLLPWWASLVRRAWRQHAWSAAALLLAPALAALVHSAYVVRVGGDFMHGRFLLPALLSALLPVASVSWSPSARPSWRLLTCLSLLVWAGICAVHFRVPYPGAIGPMGIADERGVYAREGGPNPILVEDYTASSHGRWGLFFNRYGGDPALFMDDPQVRPPLPLSEWVPSSTRVVVAFQNIGIFSYLAGSPVHVVDRWGLSDPIASRLRLRSRGRPGHEKMLTDVWIAARFADQGATKRAYPGSAAAVDAALDVLRCGEVAAFLQAIQEPLTPKRFLANIRLAWTLRGLRIPPDPLAARTELCVGRS